MAPSEDILTNQASGANEDTGDKYGGVEEVRFESVEAEKMKPSSKAISVVGISSPKSPTEFAHC